MDESVNIAPAHRYREAVFKITVCVCVGKADGSDSGLHTALLWTVFGVTAVVLDIRATVTVHPCRSKRHATDGTSP